MFGWCGEILVVDLSSMEAKRVEADREILCSYMGGRGLGARILYEYTSPSIDPFSPENVLVFAVGPLTGTRVYTSGRYAVVGKSPLTGGCFYSSSGGFFGASLKKAGLDALIVKGRAEKPVMLVVDDGDVEFKDATWLWGKGTREVRRELRRELKGFNIACIGPAGENLVRYACILNDVSNAAGRGGLGGVMGSKMLKAIAVRGSREVDVADEDMLDELMEKARNRFIWNPVLSKALSYYGTSALVNVINEHGILPTRNFQQGYFSMAEEISGEALKERIFVRKSSCFNCPVGCKRITRVGETEGEGPEYESIGALGSMLMIGTIEKVAEINYLCNDLGLDTISTGVTLACAMELSERGLLGEKLAWGDFERVKELVVDVAYRRGIGDRLAEGSRRFAESLGGEAYAMQVKGLELAMYDPRGAFGQGLGYATANRGGCHLNPYMVAVEIFGVPHLMDRFSAAGKASIVAYLQNLSAAVDSMVLCKFTMLEFDDEMYSRFLSAVTGLEFTQETVVTVGERIWNLERVYNLKAGVRTEEDKLPGRLLEPMEEGACAGKSIPFNEMLKEYYMVRGWGDDGKPRREKLERLGLGVDV
ncbi:MAG: aldehyde ferredoxin oxidoreductase family protein [Candidatus Jordarchaeales archaeon]